MKAFTLAMALLVSCGFAADTILGGGGIVPGNSLGANGVSVPVASAGLAITFVTGASAQTTSATISTPTSGDWIIVLAHRDGSTTPPTKVAGYTTIDATVGANTNSAILAFKQSDGTETSTGTWTNATSVTCVVYRNCGLGAWAITRTAGTTSPMTYGTLSMANTGGTSWVIGLGATKGSTDVGTNAPSGMTARTNALDIAAFDTNGGVASWSAQTAAVNGTPGATITYTLELLAVPSGGLVYTLIQESRTMGFASGTTASVTLTQSVGAEPHILLVSTQYTANPVEVVSIDKGGTLVPVIAMSGGAGYNNGGASYGYVAAGTTTATTPIVVTYAGTTGGGNVSIWEIAYTGTGTPALDCANRFSALSGTSVPGPAFTLSSANDFIVQTAVTTNNLTAVSNPFNAPTGYSVFPSGNAFAAVLNTTSGTAPTWTISSTGVTGLGGIAFGASPTSFKTNSIVDFEASTNGTSITVALLQASTKGWTSGLWKVAGSGAAMKFATAASRPFTNNPGRLNDGTNPTVTSSTLGIQFSTTTVQSYAELDWSGSGAEVINQNTFTAGIWFYSDLPNIDVSNMDVFTLYAPGGTGFANCKCLIDGGGLSRAFELEIPGGSSGTKILISTATWYWLSLQYNRTGSHTLKVYAADGVTLVGTLTENHTGTGMPGNVQFGQTSANTPTPGFVVNFDSLKIDPTGTYPLLPYLGEKEARILENALTGTLDDLDDLERAA